MDYYIMVSMVENMNDNDQHTLDSTWILWAHLPHDIKWDLNSYKNIVKFQTIEEVLVLFENLPDVIITNCMLFLMRNNIQPIWEDPSNKSGGCFSYKISNKNVVSCWKNLSYSLMGETLTDPSLCKYINGITISPKKNFCIIKIWLSTCDYQDADIINEIDGLPRHGCLFKRHLAET